MRALALFLAVAIFGKNVRCERLGRNAEILGTTEENNAYLDHVLEQLGESMLTNGYDPYELPDQLFDFSFILEGTVGLIDGFVNGLSRLNRVGDAILLVEENGDFYLSGDLEITHLTGGMGLLIEAAGASISPHATLSIANSDIKFVAKADPDNLILQLTQLDLGNVGNVTVDIEALGSFDFIAEILVQILSSYIKEFMADLIQGPVQLLFNQLLVEFPVDPPAV